ncbi:MAG TPA: VWA domain-containing protein [Bryobacteraceae bacterium]|nr:VWA domain-containing protein [Bryobacteraceae bacterium]
MRPLVFFTIASLVAQPAVPQERPTFSTSTNVVIVDVTVLGRDGKPVENLSKDDFELYEDGRLQPLQGCDLQRLDTKVSLALNPPPPGSSIGRASPLPATTADTARDHRLIVLLFDFSSMQPTEQIRATDAAVKFVSTQMTSSDLVSIMVFASSLQAVQDFTPDRDLLISTLQKFHIGDSSELASLGDTGPDPEDESGLFVADETEFNIFNTDRKLAALEDTARKLSAYPQKKALVYFSAGVEKTGVDNQSQLRATINTAVQSNVAFYPIDARGLLASAPGGDATKAGAVGSKLYSGAGQRALSDSFHNQQETLYSLAADTGGKALLDSNDLTLGIAQVQKDIASYYVLSYASSNQAEDGRYRRIQVKVVPRLAAMKLKLDYRAGYFAPTTFAKMSSSDKEARLQQALESENPSTDLPIAVEVDYFRLAKDKYFVPVSVKIPGSALSFRSKGRKAATELDFIAEVRDAHRVASVVRDTIPLKLDDATAGRVGRKQVQYDTGLTLAPGKYTLRFVARENGEGKVGTFETPFTIPDLSSGNALRLSSVILSNQREPLKQQIAAVKNDKELLAENPLIDSSGRKIVPNVTRVFRSGQNLFVYLEVYDPITPEKPSQNRRVASIAANLTLFNGTRKVMDTPQVYMTRLDSKRDRVLPVRLTIPFTDLKPGQYTCQINVIDELGRKFSFPRTPLFVMATGDPGARTSPQ